MEGLDGKKDHEEALFHFRKGEYAEHTLCLFALGRVYRRGYSVEKNTIKAMDYYQRALSGGFGFADNNIGAVYYEGCDIFCSQLIEIKCHFS